jgi:hypothetical protein
MSQLIKFDKSNIDLESLRKHGEKLYTKNEALKALVDVVRHPVLTEYLKPKLGTKNDMLEAMMMLKTGYYITEHFEKDVGSEIDGFQLAALIEQLLGTTEFRVAMADEITENVPNFIENSTTSIGTIKNVSIRKM